MFSAKRAQFFLDTGLVWAENVVVRKLGVDGEVETLQGMAESASDAALAEERRLAAARTALAEAQSARAALRADLAACETRVKLLEEAARSPEGLPAGAAAFLAGYLMTKKA